MYDVYRLLYSQHKLCGRDGTITMIPGQRTPLTIEQSQKGEKACLIVFDCRGHEPVDFSFSDGWKAESVSFSWFSSEVLMASTYAKPFFYDIISG